MSVRVYPDIPRVYVDMDGPMADFGRMMEDTGLPASELKLRPGTYLKLQPTVGAIDAVLQIQQLGFFVMVLTKIPSKNPYAASEKIMWLNRYIPELKDHIIITPDKGCVGTSRDFLIDDHPEWANAHSFVGEVITFNTDRPALAWSEILTTFRIVSKTIGGKVDGGTVVGAR